MSVTVAALVLAAALVWPGWRSGSGLAVAGTTSGGGTPGPWWPRRRRGGRLEDLEALAVVADLLAMALRSGATPQTALRVVGEQAPRTWQPVLLEAEEVAARGGMVGALWRRHALERSELSSLAGAWSLSEDLGVALAPSMATSAQVLRARVRARRALEASTAGARATMRLLTVLPLVGLLAGFAFGLTPWEVYGHSVLTAACAVVGLTLTAVGWVVCRWLLARAVAPREHA